MFLHVMLRGVSLSTLQGKATWYQLALVVSAAALATVRSPRPVLSPLRQNPPPQPLASTLGGSGL
jgi:hypothetical protein